MFSSYHEALQYLYDNLPMFQRVGASAITKDLTNTLKLCSMLGNPQHGFRSVHIAGTNGKGSTSHMLAAVLQSAGYRTGLYTSPHLKEFTERIKVDGQEISRDYVLDFVNRILPSVEEIRPSFFEITVAMAFDYFAKSEVDIAIVEVGLGGRLDSTNVITPLVSVITNISWDHKELLGDTLPKIAAEKAGIIKRNIPVVVSERQHEVEEVFIQKAKAEGAELFFASDTYTSAISPEGAIDIFGAGRLLLKGIRISLHGAYQRYNVPGVLKTIDVLQTTFPTGEDDFRNGLEKVTALTGLKGRWQVLSNNPTVVCDTGHNEAGIREILGQISSRKFDRLHMVLGMVKDKDVSRILSMLPKDAAYYFCQANIPRALDAEQLRTLAREFGLQGEVIRNVNEAKASALSRAGKNDFIFIGGSTYVVAELDEL